VVQPVIQGVRLLRLARGASVLEALRLISHGVLNDELVAERLGPGVATPNHVVGIAPNRRGCAGGDK
jgi:hypothetical protein